MLSAEILNRFEAEYELTKKKRLEKYWGLGGGCWVCESCQAGYKVSHACGSGYGKVESALGLDTGVKVANAVDDATCFQGTKSLEGLADLATGGAYSGIKDAGQTIAKTASCAGSESWIPVIETVMGGLGTTGWSSGATGVGASNATWEGIDAAVQAMQGEECGEAGCVVHKQDGDDTEKDEEIQGQDSVDTYDEEKNETAKEAAQEGQGQAESAAKEALAIGANPANASDIATGQAGTLSRSQYNDLYGSVANSKASTQADYLNKMGYANSLAQQASNIKKGSGLNVASGVLQGMGAGASAGAGFSDENLKENVNENDVISHIGKLVDMMTEVEQLKKARKKEND